MEPQLASVLLAAGEGLTSEIHCSQPSHASSNMVFPPEMRRHLGHIAQEIIVSMSEHLIDSNMDRLRELNPDTLYHEIFRCVTANRPRGNLPKSPMSLSRLHEHLTSVFGKAQMDALEKRHVRSYLATAEDQCDTLDELYKTPSVVQGRVPFGRGHFDFATQMTKEDIDKRLRRANRLNPRVRLATLPLEGNRRELVHLRENERYVYVDELEGGGHMPSEFEQWMIQRERRRQRRRLVREAAEEAKSNVQQEQSAMDTKENIVGQAEDVSFSQLASVMKTQRSASGPEGSDRVQVTLGSLEEEDNDKSDPVRATIETQEEESNDKVDDLQITLETQQEEDLHEGELVDSERRNMETQDDEDLEQKDVGDAGQDMA